MAGAWGHRGRRLAQDGLQRSQCICDWKGDKTRNFYFILCSAERYHNLGILVGGGQRNA